ncbi:hypothetical protein GCM10027299_20330 [Larkinella ripae]
MYFKPQLPKYGYDPLNNKTYQETLHMDQRAGLAKDKEPNGKIAAYE